ncbi:MAG: hypothetical protein IKU03_06430 [Bacteroidales bacterium]|nr:hypothetical protein [Bacteroidales bacterium]
MNFPNPQPVQVVLDMNDTFGCTTDYYLFMVKSELPPMAFAHLCSQWFQVDFSYLQNYTFDTVGQDVSVPVFSALLRQQNNLMLAIVPNKIMTHLNNPDDEFTLSIPMFEDLYYFLGKNGFCRYECPYEGYDYVLLVTVDRESPIDDVLLLLEQHPELDIRDITELLFSSPAPEQKPAKRKTKVKKTEKQPLDDFLKSSCLEIVRAHNAMMNGRVNRFLGANRHIPEVNYVHKVKSIFELLQLPNPDNTQKESLVMESQTNQKLLTREDV